MKNEFFFVVFCLLNCSLLAQDTTRDNLSITVQDSTSIKKNDSTTVIADTLTKAINIPGTPAPAINILTTPTLVTTPTPTINTSPTPTLITTPAPVIDAPSASITPTTTAPTPTITIPATPTITTLPSSTTPAKPSTTIKPAIPPPAAIPSAPLPSKPLPQTTAPTNTAVTTPKVHYRFGESSFTDDRKLVFPTVGLGVGVLSFFGDVTNNISKSPLNGRIAADLNISQRISNCFTVNFHAIMGKVGANERFTSNNRNANFQSTIRGGGITLTYDFGNLLPEGRNATPFISLGVISFEFFSKTDLKDKNGNTYFYWSDGTIRNMNENSPNAGNAILLKRDYTYESDVRNTTLDKLGKYPQYSFAIPLGIGFSFRINNFITFRVSSTMYYTLTDNIDGIVAKNPKRIIPGNKDNFMMSSCGLSYNFGYKPPVVVPEFASFSNPNVNFYKINTGDSDKDGVSDIKDSCQRTPVGIAVDTVGCPFDSDGDGIPDYKDKEVNSPKGAIVNTKGVQLTDSVIADMYDRYINTTMKYAATQQMEFIKAAVEDKFVVNIGTYNKSNFTRLPSKIVSDSSIVEIKITDTTSMYVTLPYDYVSDAESRRDLLISEGIMKDSVRIMVKQGASYLGLEPTNIIVPNDTINYKENPIELNNNAPIDNSNAPINPEEEKPKRLKFLFRSKQKSE